MDNLEQAQQALRNSEDFSRTLYLQHLELLRKSRGREKQLIRLLTETWKLRAAANLSDLKWLIEDSDKEAALSEAERNARLEDSQGFEVRLGDGKPLKIQD